MHVSQLLCGEAPAATTTPDDARAVDTSTAPAPPTKRPRQQLLKHKPYRKFYTNPVPSSHCHICARTSKAVRFVNCSKLKVGLCRKVICDKCFDKFGWDFQAAFNDAQWTCPHCRNACPPGKSQCFIYERVNRKRESKRKAAPTATAKKKKNDNNINVNMSPLAILAKATTASAGIKQFPRNFSSASTASNSSYSPPPSVYADPPSPYGVGHANSIAISPMSVTNVTSYGTTYQQQYQLPVSPAPDPVSVAGTPAFRYGMNPTVLFNIPNLSNNTDKKQNFSPAIPIEKLLAPEPCALSVSSRQSTQWSPSLQLDKTCGIEMRDIPKGCVISPLNNINTTTSSPNPPLPRLPPAPRSTLRWN